MYLHLQNKSSQKDDNEILKGLPKVKTECTWIPWTFNRLSFYSGYGAGINSPGWYNHVWHHPHDDGTFGWPMLPNCSASSKWIPLLRIL
jgi:hypothetical protein